MDFLELPMIALHCPIAGFLDPSDSMVNDERTFFVALLFWAAVIPVAFRIPSRKRSPLIIAFAIIVTFAVASTAYVLVIGFSRKPVY